MNDMWQMSTSTSWQLIHIGRNIFIDPLKIISLDPIDEQHCCIITKHQNWEISVGVDEVMKAIAKWSEKRNKGKQ